MRYLSAVWGMWHTRPSLVGFLGIGDCHPTCTVRIPTCIPTPIHRQKPFLNEDETCRYPSGKAHDCILMNAISPVVVVVVHRTSCHSIGYHNEWISLREYQHHESTARETPQEQPSWMFEVMDA